VGCGLPGKGAMRAQPADAPAFNSTTAAMLGGMNATRQPRRTHPALMVCEPLSITSGRPARPDPYSQHGGLLKDAPGVVCSGMVSAVCNGASQQQEGNNTSMQQKQRVQRRVRCFWHFAHLAEADQTLAGCLEALLCSFWPNLDVV